MGPDCTLCSRDGMNPLGNVVEAGRRMDVILFFSSANRARQTLRPCGRWQKHPAANSTESLPLALSSLLAAQCHSEWLLPIQIVAERYGLSVSNLAENL